MDEKFSPREQYQAQIDRAATYITEHLEEPLNLKKLANLSHFSPFHFHRIFTTAIGETPQDFTNRLRLEHAANLLLKSSFSITETAYACGFSSPATFARSFKKHFGLTAREYTRRGQILLPESPLKENEKPFVPPEVQVQMMPGLHLAYIVSMKGYSLAAICRAWERICRWASAHELFTSQTRIVGISFDDPLITPKEKCRYYACITVPPEITGDERVGVLDIPPSRCAVCRAAVPAEQIERVYRYFFQDWLPDSGLQPANYPSYEIYYETPETNALGNYIMDVCVPVLRL